MAQRLFSAVSCALGMNRGKPLKIQDRAATRRIGVVARTLHELNKKGVLKLNMGDQVVRVVLEEDGSLIEDEDFFNSLEDNTVLVFLCPGEVWNGYITYLKMATSKLVNNMSAHNHTITESVKSLYDPDSPELSLLVEYVETLQANVEGDTRNDDPQWFEGVQARLNTKTEVLRDSAKQRIRNYLYKTKEHLEKTPHMNSVSQDMCTEVIRKFTDELKKHEYYGEYFDRTLVKKNRDELICSSGTNENDQKDGLKGTSKDEIIAKPPPVHVDIRISESKKPLPWEPSYNPAYESTLNIKPSTLTASHLTLKATTDALSDTFPGHTKDDKQWSMCTSKGWFSCEGAFDEPRCHHHHTINPYATRQSRILFSTWNLDHVVEKSRAVLPALVRAVVECPSGYVVDWYYFFRMLFTRENLKLVDIRCHKKCVHVGCQVDEIQLYLPVAS